MLYCLRKRALIFVAGRDCMALSPEDLPGGSVDTDIPILAVYNGWHYQVTKMECQQINMQNIH
jgi:hypothetical protein